MKNLILTGLTGLAALTFVAAEAQADDRYRGVGSQYTINAGSGLVVNNSVVDRYSSRSRHDNDRFDRNRRHDDRNRYDRDRRDHDRYRSDRTSAFLSTGNLSIYWSDGDYRRRPVYNTYRRHDNGRHLGHYNRSGRYLQDRWGNCYRIEGNGRFERRVKVRDSRCRF